MIEVTRSSDNHHSLAENSSRIGSNFLCFRPRKRYLPDYPQCGTNPGVPVSRPETRLWGHRDESLVNSSANWGNWGPSIAAILALGHTRLSSPRDFEPRKLVREGVYFVTNPMKLPPSRLLAKKLSACPSSGSNARLGPGSHFDYRADVIASDAKRLRFWSRLRRAPTPRRAHSQEPVGRPDSA